MADSLKMDNNGGKIHQSSRQTDHLESKLLGVLPRAPDLKRTSLHSCIISGPGHALTLEKLLTSFLDQVISKAIPDAWIANWQGVTEGLQQHLCKLL